MPRKLIKPKLPPEEHGNCGSFLLSFRDALEVVSGKWKSPILLSLGFKGTLRFGELQRLHNGIPAKTLSKELKDLETNGLVKRTVLDTMPVTVQYEITTYGRTLEAVLLQLHGWGVKHREYTRNGWAEKKEVRKVGKPARLEVVG